MAEERDREGKSGRPAKSDARQDRLAQALRANLLKRKEKIRAGKSAAKPRDEGRQG